MDRITLITKNESLITTMGVPFEKGKKTPFSKVVLFASVKKFYVKFFDPAAITNALFAVLKDFFV